MPDTTTRNPLALIRHAISRATSRLLPSTQTVDVLRGPAAGVTLRGSWDQDLWVALGLYEPEIKDHVDALAKPGQTIADVGAGRGYYTLAWAAQGATVNAYEADIIRRQQIVTARAMNTLPSIHVYGPLTSLDQLVGHPDGIKVDVEGEEVALFTDAADTLHALGYPWLIVETHSDHARSTVLEALPDAYEVHVVDQGRGLLRAGDRNRARGWVVAQQEDAADA